MIDLLFEINAKKPVTVELGLQTIHEATARAIRRGYPLEVYDKAVDDLHRIGVSVITHVILGLPGETEEMMYETVRYIADKTDGVKLQLLHVLLDTDLADLYRKGEFSTLSLEDYTRVLCGCIELLPKNVVICRITGDGDKRSLIAPLWSADKKTCAEFHKRLYSRPQYRAGDTFRDKNNR